jgi:hypothetical protein
MLKIILVHQCDTWICENTGINPTQRVVAQWIENARGSILSTAILNSWTKLREIGTNGFGPILLNFIVCSLVITNLSA